MLGRRLKPSQNQTSSAPNRMFDTSRPTMHTPTLETVSRALTAAPEGDEEANVGERVAEVDDVVDVVGTVFFCVPHI